MGEHWGVIQSIPAFSKCGLYIPLTPEPAPGRRLVNSTTKKTMSVQLCVHLFGQNMSAKKPLACRTPDGGQLQDAGESEFSEAPSSHQRYL